MSAVRRGGDIWARHKLYDIYVRLRGRTVQQGGSFQEQRTNERRKEERKDNEGVDPAPRNHTPRRESWRRDSFLVTLRCLTGPMTSGGRAMMEEPINGTRVDPIDVWSFIYRRGDWRKKEKGKRRGWKSFDNCSLKLESEVWWKNWKMLIRNDRIGNNLEEHY